MDIEALKWYRDNSDFTENSGRVGKKPIVYPTDPRFGNVYLDVVKSDGLLYYGTPVNTEQKIKLQNTYQ